MRLDVNPSIPHTNPNDTVVVGSHLHRYIEGVGSKTAVPYDTGNMSFADCCVWFFEQFHVVDYPEITIKEDGE